MESNDMSWININQAYPTKEKYYRCLCLGFRKLVKCKFKKAKNGPREYCPNLFIHRRKILFVRYWKE
jgi:hypothetical protein